jgi:hypothetical protein
MYCWMGMAEERLREMMKQAGSEVPTAATVKADTETTDGSNAGTD